MNKHTLIVSAILSSIPFISSEAQSGLKITPGKLWPDTEGYHINAHGGAILKHKRTWYWFGESRLPKGERDWTNYGVGCYSSKDLVEWDNEGLALQVIDDTTSLLRPGCVIERPKVIYNKKTGKFVMWFHHELRGEGYRAALTGVAVSDNVSGPYKYLRSLRPNAKEWPVNFPDEFKNITVNETDFKGDPAGRIKAVKEGLYLRRDFEGGQMARDMTLFVDRDGKVYHIHSSEENLTLHFSELTDDYLDFTGNYYRVLPGESNEAPAIFYANKKYYMFTSGTTGWKPNPGRLASSDKITGEWKSLGNHCRGTADENNTTFRSQSTFVLPLNPGKNKFIYMGDRWIPENLADSRHIWLPVEWEGDIPVIKWHQSWDLKQF